MNHLQRIKQHDSWPVECNIEAETRISERNKSRSSQGNEQKQQHEYTGVTRLPNKGIQMPGKGTKNTHDSSPRLARKLSPRFLAVLGRSVCRYGTVWMTRDTPDGFILVLGQFKTGV